MGVSDGIEVIEWRSDARTVKISDMGKRRHKGITIKQRLLSLGRGGPLSRDDGNGRVNEPHFGPHGNNGGGGGGGGGGALVWAIHRKKSSEASGHSLVLMQT